MESSDSDSEFEQNTPPELTKTAKIATLDLLPAKSRGKYEKQYDVFMQWSKRHKVGKITENVLLAFFAENAKVLKPSTLWSQYSMLRATLAIKQNIHINTFSKLIAFLKQKAAGFKPKKSKTFSKSEVEKFLLNAPDEKYLMAKVALIIGVSGACRCAELCKMTLDDIQDKGSVIIVTIPDTKTKRQRIFTITNGTTNNISIYKKYVALRPTIITHNRLFIYYKSNKCTVQAVGINTFSKLPGLIAEYLQLPELKLFTGHCFRRTSATILANEGGDLLSLKRHGGWRSSSVAEGYVDEAISNKITVANKILGEVNNANTSNGDESYNSAVYTTDANADQFRKETPREIQCSNVAVCEIENSANSMNMNMQASKHITTNIPGVQFGTLNNCTINLYVNKQ